ncbi:MOSC domain-containing protein [Candidatus Persebacteraceae bacterium Df01]|uniref:MOSC domain-containing protein n=1 Tax=Candidatus Doriopsillibacter californiensis TaxID=2970740 RepID=A0ABT7QND5_9GAMM|nr:MOSC domain-containing protein [Candidatus Persebacteraceae bacterium Df01]
MVEQKVVVSNIWRYPIKGLAGESLTTTILSSGRGIVYDRRWLLATADTAPLLNGNDKWRPWNYGLTLKKAERMALLRCSVVDDNGAPLLSIYEKNEMRVCGHPQVPDERANIDGFLQDFLFEPALQLTDYQNWSIWDKKDVVLTLLNESSVADFSTKQGVPVSCQRFRANIEVRGMTAWKEMGGGVMHVGDVQLQLGDGVERCAATRVNPQTAERDMNVPAQLLQEYGRNEMGVEAAVLTGGEIATSMEVVRSQTS